MRCSTKRSMHQMKRYRTSLHVGVVNDKIANAAGSRLENVFFVNLLFYQQVMVNCSEILLVSGYDIKHRALSAVIKVR